MYSRRRFVFGRFAKIEQGECNRASLIAEPQPILFKKPLLVRL